MLSLYNMEAKITDISAVPVSNSHGDPTIQTHITVNGNITGTFAAPAGTSTGGYEAVPVAQELALQLINQSLKATLVDKVYDPQGLDDFLISLDNTPNKSRLGANTILSISVAFVKALAMSNHMPLYTFIHHYIGRKITDKPRMPHLMLNLIEGGKHADFSVDFQEYLLVPRVDSTQASIDYGKKVIERIRAKFPSATTGMEGGVCIRDSLKNADMLQILNDCAKAAGNLPYDISLDIAANSFKKGAEYNVRDIGESASVDQLETFYVQLFNKYPVFSAEDPFSEDEWSNWGSLRSKLNGKTKIIGDDLTSTNLERLDKAIKIGAIDGLIIKPNQIGTVSQTLEVVKRAKENNLLTIVSHRAGETMDDFIADLAVGVDADLLKSGAPTQKERLVKYERLVEIEKELGIKA